jgi:hypothetical protein
MKMPLLRKILRGVSLTSAMFIFQACYGTPSDFGLDVRIEGNVKAVSTGLSVKGIKVSVTDNQQYTYTDDSGNFLMYTEKTDIITLRFEDIDDVQNGLFQNLDTILINPQANIVLAVSLKDR